MAWADFGGPILGSGVSPEWSEPAWDMPAAQHRMLRTSGGVRFRVLSMDDNRVEWLEGERLPQPVPKKDDQ